MSSLRAKLGRLSSAGPGSAPPAPPSPLHDAFAAALRAELPMTPAQPPTRQLPGQTRVTVHGEVQLVERRFAPGYLHGMASVARALEVDGALLGQLARDPSLADVDLGRALYLDTETTGLSGGTGTVPFLIGLGAFDEGHFRVDQLFLPELGGERPMLSLLAERISEASVVVTYNGKSFDWPLLRARFVMNRLRPPPLARHLDLLHPARRAFKARLPSMRLVALERTLLSMARQGDVDGALIPEIYLSYLRDGAHPLLGQVIEHNALDLVGLAALLGDLGARYANANADGDPCDNLSFARIAERAGDSARALAFARSVGCSAPTATAARLLEARLARRAGHLDVEERALLAALEAAAQGTCPSVHLALAKLYEHRRGDYARALVHARAAQEAEPLAAHERRLARLERKRANSLTSFVPE